MLAAASIAAASTASFALALVRLSDDSAINFLWMIASVQLAGLLITLPGMAVLQQSMITGVNRTHDYAPVKPVWHLGIAQRTELETVYRDLFPDSWKADIYNVLRTLAQFMGGIGAFAYTCSRILHIWANPGGQP